MEDKRTREDCGDAADGSQAKEKKFKNENLDDDDDDEPIAIGHKQMGIGIMKMIVDYYFYQWRCPLDDSSDAEDFIKNWLEIADVTQLKLIIMQKVERLKRYYKLRVEKNKGKKWVFLDLDDLEFIKLADFLWGVNGISKSSDYEEIEDL